MRRALAALLAVALTGLAWSQSYNLGQKVLAASGGRWYPAKIVGLMEGGLYRVHYYGYGDSYEENLSAESLKPVQMAHTYREGERVYVDWQRSSYEADILDWSASKGYLIHYLGYSSSYDEWVDEGRIHPHNTTYNWQPGDQVQVLWGSTWYNATIVSSNSYSNYKIHYDGWDPDYDETVSYTRIRQR